MIVPKLTHRATTPHTHSTYSSGINRYQTPPHHTAHSTTASVQDLSSNVTSAVSLISQDFQATTAMSGVTVIGILASQSMSETELLA
jgi:hypothetical protein